MPVQSVSLYYRDLNSDKEYHASIEPAGQRFVVNFAYGRRGSTLNTGTKTNVPVEFEAAQRVFTKLNTEKKSKGYTEGEAGTRLIQAPASVADYIILHELMHIWQMNHSPKFWREVENVCPDFRNAEKWLKMHSLLLR